jgi:hypothetical protein
MSTGLLSPSAEFDTAPPDTYRLPAADARAHVHSVIRLLLQHSIAVERRRDRRYPYPHLVTLIPVAPDGTHLTDETTVVVGKQLSVGGLNFYHREPIPHRRAIVVLEAGGNRAALLMDLTWCRFTRRGWYENGGRFLQAVTAHTNCGRPQEDTHGLSGGNYFTRSEYDLGF